MSGYMPDEMNSAEGDDGDHPRGMFSDGVITERWDSRCTVRFVKLYGMYPCLWDQRQPEYKNRHARDQAVQSIVDAMGLEGFDIQACRRKIRIIRSTYWNECAKISRSVAQGTPYSPKLVWFPLANRFLSKISGLGDVQNWKTEHEHQAQQQSQQQHQHQQQQQQQQHQQQQQQQQQHQQQRHQQQHHNFLTPDVPRIRGMVKLEPEEADPIGLDDVDDVEGEDGTDGADGVDGVDEASFCSPAGAEDEFDVFGRSVACQLKQLPLREALQLQMLIQALISKHRLRWLQEQQQQQRPAQAGPASAGGAGAGAGAGPRGGAAAQRADCWYQTQRGMDRLS
ncbi:hypothetical protein R5R35_000826 [Gryllus longicercus]|uniref:MADF domain-containing protein n=1 Tax=Gryllus longicercus TaxID=2509291 RepID=A0AAN9VAG0_9ORTH